MNVRPLFDNVIVTKLELDDSTTEGGLILPDSARETPDQALVLAVGPGRKSPDGGREDMDVEVGDKVFLPPFAGTPIEWKMIQMRIVGQEDILAVLP